MANPIGPATTAKYQETVLLEHATAYTILGGEFVCYDNANPGVVKQPTTATLANFAGNIDPEERGKVVPAGGRVRVKINRCPSSFIPMRVTGNSTAGTTVYGPADGTFVGAVKTGVASANAIQQLVSVAQQTQSTGGTLNVLGQLVR